MLARRGTCHIVRHTVDTVIISMHSTHAFNQYSVTNTTSTKSMGFGLAITARGDEPTSPVMLQRLADELDRETIPVFIDASDHFRRCGSRYDTKKLTQP